MVISGTGTKALQSCKELSGNLSMLVVISSCLFSSWFWELVNVVLGKATSSIPELETGFTGELGGSSVMSHANI